jgi:alpha-L-fucosidase
MEIGGWLGTNGEGIYAASAWKQYGEGPVAAAAPSQAGPGPSGSGQPLPNPNRPPQRVGMLGEEFRFTTKGETLYVFGMRWPAGEALVKSRACAIVGQALSPANRFFHSFSWSRL